MRSLATALALFAVAPQVLTFHSDIDDTDQGYAIHVPSSYSADRTWPLVVALHNEATSHLFAVRRVLAGGGDGEMIVASPRVRGDVGPNGTGEQDVLDMLADVMRRYRIDPDRVYLTGESTGGGGALWLALSRPDLWAAVALVNPIYSPTVEPLMGNVLNLPVRVYQGEADPRRSGAQNRALADRLQAEYAERRAVGLLTWFSQNQRVTRPSRVRFAALSYRYGSANWVRFANLTPGLLASVNAEFSDGRVSVEAVHLNGFVLEPARMPGRATAVSVNGQAVRLRPNAALSFRFDGKVWTQGPAEPAARDKRPGAEGPVAAATASRHVYVYGTLDSPEPDEVKRRRDIAVRATANLPVKTKVVSDTEDEPGNLVLFGNRLTNSLIHSYPLPIHLSPSAADYGLVYVYPVNGRYVLINSGLPWWTQAEGTPPWRVLERFGDFILFRGAVQNVIAAGRFDAHWKLPPDAAEAMRKTGAVEISESK